MAAKKQPQNKKCPNCGACQECGHAPVKYVPYPVYPYQPFPWGTTPRPRGPYWVSGGTTTSGTGWSSGTTYQNPNAGGGQIQ